MSGGSRSAKSHGLKLHLVNDWNKCNSRLGNFADLQRPHPEAGSHSLDLDGQHRLEAMPSDACLTYVSLTDHACQQPSAILFGTRQLVFSGAVF